MQASPGSIRLSPAGPWKIDIFPLSLFLTELGLIFPASCKLQLIMPKKKKKSVCARGGFNVLLLK